MSPSIFLDRAQLEKRIEKAKRKLGSEVVRANHSLGTDWSGDPAIYFRIVLTDAASQEDGLVDVTLRISTFLTDEIRPYELGLIDYCSFRSKSENDARHDPGWT